MTIYHGEGSNAQIRNIWWRKYQEIQKRANGNMNHMLSSAPFAGG